MKILGFIGYQLRQKVMYMKKKGSGNRSITTTVLIKQRCCTHKKIDCKCSIILICTRLKLLD